jgi:hypothetical protein
MPENKPSLPLYRCEANWLGFPFHFIELDILTFDRLAFRKRLADFPMRTVSCGGIKYYNSVDEYENEELGQWFGLTSKPNCSKLFGDFRSLAGH